MALTPLRWTAALLLVMAGTLAVVSRPGEVESNRVVYHRTPEAAAHSRAVAQLRRVHTRLEEARHRDSVIVIADALAGGELRVHISEALPGSVAQYLSVLVQRQWVSARRVSAPVMPSVFVAIIDTRNRPRFLSDASALILPSESSPHCIALLRVGPRALGRIDDGVAVEAALQPASPGWQRPLGLSGCAWYALFGRPGSEIARWLRATGYAYAGAAPGDTSGGEPAPVVPIDSLRGWGVGILGLACSAGNEDACRRVLMGVARRRFFSRVPSVLDDMVTVQSVPGGFGPRQFHFLADMVADIGPEAFQRFWSSELPIEGAFREANGVELMEWTQAWARWNVGPVEGGPMPTLASAAGVSLLVLFGLVVGVGRRGGTALMIDGL